MAIKSKTLIKARLAIFGEQALRIQILYPNNMTKPFLLCIFISISLGVISCGDHNKSFVSNYIATAQTGFKKMPWPGQMESLFGEGNNFIESYGGHLPLDWQTEVFFSGRYVLTLRVFVTVDYNCHEISAVTSTPEFKLLEVKSIDYVNGQPRGVSFSHQWNLDENQWNKLVAAKGDWTAIGINLRTNQPVAGFDEHYKAARNLWLKIPH